MVKALPNLNISIHGTALLIFGFGIIITGESKIGKSELALALINRGHKFINDDIVNIYEKSEELTLVSDNNFLYIRGIGFIDIVKTHGIESTAKNAKFNLIIELVNSDKAPLDPLEQMIKSEIFGNYSIKKFQLFISPNRPLADLVEIFVKYYENCCEGYNSHEIFINQQDRKLCN